VHAGYARVLQHELPQADAIRWRIKSEIGSPAPEVDIRDRFLARARMEGIEFSSEVERSRGSRASLFRRSWQWRFALAAPALAALVIVVVWVGRKYQPAPYTAAPNVASVELGRENESLRTELAALRLRIEQETSELSNMGRANSTSRESVQILQHQLENARAQADRLSADLQQKEDDKARLASGEQQKDTVIADLRTQNEKLHREKVDLLSTSVIQEGHIRELTESLQQQTASLEREGQLMTVSKDVRQLIGARNLHIIDVHDVDGGGKAAKSFGRVFYAEGQSLIFYAFDLPSGRLSPAKYTFHAWGQREYVAQSVRDLGSFEVDDHEQRRWVLKVTDPALLGNMDSVFVTAEALGDAKEPRGKKLLYAYIVGQANHP
jgi:hypothetical protein